MAIKFLDMHLPNYKSNGSSEFVSQGYVPSFSDSNHSFPEIHSPHIQDNNKSNKTQR